MKSKVASSFKDKFLGRRSGYPGTTVARLISDVYAGKLHPRIAVGLAPLMHLAAPGARENGDREAPGQGGAAVARVDRAALIVRGSESFSKT
jgi:hypothetical protein